jgi:hypothetical protein
MSDKKELDKITHGEDLNSDAKKDIKNKGEFLRKENTQFLTKWSWSPNAEKGLGFAPPTGFAITVKSSAPLKPEVFPKSEMFNGTCALRLPSDLIAENSTVPINAEFIRSNINIIRDRLDQVVKQNVDVKPSLLCMDPQSTTRDSMVWKACLSGSGCSVGVYYTTERMDEFYKETVWLVVSSGIKEGSSQLYRLMNEPKGTKVTDIFPDKTHLDSNRHTDDEFYHTWGEFLSRPEVGYLKNLSRRNRLHLLYLALRAIGVSQESMKASKELKVKADNYLEGLAGNREDLIMMVEPTMETNTNDFYASGQGSDLNITFYSNTCDSRSVVSGLIIKESPYLGYTILKGPGEKDLGKNWYSDRPEKKAVADGIYGMFPVSTGKNPSLSPNSEMINTGTYVPLIFWESQKSSEKLAKLTKNYYNTRNSEFRHKENTLGYDPSWGSVQLIPLLVKVSNPNL